MIETTMAITMQWSDWIDLFGRYMLLSLLSIGGAITALPEMHRYLVDQNRWLMESQFTSSIAIAQASPGPNMLFVALMGWNVGINAGGMHWGLLGVLATTVGLLLPSTTLTILAARWGHKNRELRSVRAFKLGMAPVVIPLIVASGWIMASAYNEPARDWKLWLLIIVTVFLVWLTQIHLLWLLAAGALLGWFGWI